MINDRSHVSMGVDVCPICGEHTQNGTILLDKRLKPSMEKYTPTGWGPCEEHQKLIDEGWAFLIVTDNNDQDSPTGELIQIRKEQWHHLCPDAPDIPIVRIKQALADKFHELIDGPAHEQPDVME